MLDKNRSVLRKFGSVLHKNRSVLRKFGSVLYKNRLMPISLLLSCAD